MTDAVSAGRFPANEPLNNVGLRQLENIELGRADAGVCGPELRARQTAENLGLIAAAEPALTDLDIGSWQGLSLADVDPDALAAWLTDPAAAPHGGESIVALTQRVAGWMNSLQAQKVVAVTHPAVIRAALVAALNAPPISFWRIDIAPASRTVLHRRAPGWTLRL